MYVLSTGCQWRAIPKDLPPRSTVYDYFDRWNWDGTLDRIHDALYVKCREAAAREASPTAAIIDSQSVKSAEKGGPASIRRVMTQARVRLEGAYHLWRKVPPRELSIDPEADERLGRATGWAKPRDKGRLGRPSDPTGRNASEVRAGLEKVDADADPPFARGRPRRTGKQSTRAPVWSAGVWDTARWKGDAGNRGRPVRSEVAASTPLQAVDRTGVGQGHMTVEAG